MDLKSETHGDHHLLLRLVRWDREKQPGLGDFDLAGGDDRVRRMNMCILSRRLFVCLVFVEDFGD